MLGEYDVDESGLKLINGFSTFMSEFIVIFIDRFFELKGKLNQKIIDPI